MGKIDVSEMEAPVYHDRHGGSSLSCPPGGHIEQLLDPQTGGHVAQAAPVNLSGCNFGWGALHLAGQRFPDRTSPLYGGDSGFAGPTTS